GIVDHLDFRGDPPWRVRIASRMVYDALGQIGGVPLDVTDEDDRFVRLGRHGAPRFDKASRTSSQHARENEGSRVVSQVLWPELGTQSSKSSCAPPAVGRSNLPSVYVQRALEVI